MWLVVGDTEMGERVLELGSGMVMLLWSFRRRDENSPGLECLYDGELGGTGVLGSWAGEDRL